MKFFSKLAEASVRAEADHEHAESELTKLMRAGRIKFQRLDEDRSGFLKDEEVLEMAEWVWKTFHRGEPPSKSKRMEEASKILKRCDVDDDGTFL